MADGGGLENRYGVTPIVGSNPTPSALTSTFTSSRAEVEHHGRSTSPACPLRARTDRARARCQAAETFGNLGITALCRVLIDHRGADEEWPARRITSARVAPLWAASVKPGMAKIVEVGVGKVGPLPRRAPGRVHMVGAEGGAVLSDEQPGGRQRRSAQPEVLVQRIDALGRQMDGPVASGLRWPLLGAGVGLDDLSSHLHRPRVRSTSSSRSARSSPGADAPRRRAPPDRGDDKASRRPAAEPAGRRGRRRATPRGMEGRRCSPSARPATPTRPKSAHLLHGSHPKARVDRGRQSGATARLSAGCFRDGGFLRVSASPRQFPGV